LLESAKAIMPNMESKDRNNMIDIDNDEIKAYMVLKDFNVQSAAYII